MKNNHQINLIIKKTKLIMTKQMEKILKKELENAQENNKK